MQPKTEAPMTIEAKPVECACSGGEIAEGWFCRVTVKCPFCGRRISEMLKGKGKLADAWPQKITCKNRHEFLVAPYRWEEEHSTK